MILPNLAKNTRESNIELLRIVAMAIVVLSHIALLSPEYSTMVSNGGYKGFELLFLRLGKVGVHIFFLISGYFTYKYLALRTQGLVRVWGVTFFYSVLFLIIGLILSPSQISSTDTINAIFPVLFNQYWFVTTFILIGLMAPAFNSIIINVSQYKFKLFLIIALPLYYLLSLLFNTTNWVSGFDFAYSLITYSLTYLLGAYLALYPPKIRNVTLITALTLSVLIFSAWCIATIKGFIPIDKFPILIADNGIIVFIMAICIFLLFLRIKIKIRFINYIASSMFAIYLIHTNKTFIDTIFSIFSLNKFYETNWFFIIPFVYLIIIMIICVVIDKVRIYILQKILTLKLNKKTT